MGTGTEEFAAFPEHTRLHLVCVSETFRPLESPHAPGHLSPYNASRYSWKIDTLKAKRAEYVMGVCHGDIVGVFQADEWLPAKKANFTDIPDNHGNWGEQKGRFGFRGSEAPIDVKNRFIGKKVPPEWRFKGNSVLYVNF